jgi:hypothetical protein
MAKGVYDELRRPRPRRHVTVGIVDDTRTSVAPDMSFRVPTRAVQAVFYGLGSDDAPFPTAMMTPRPTPTRLTHADKAPTPPPNNNTPHRMITKSHGQTP